MRRWMLATLPLLLLAGPAAAHDAEALAAIDTRPADTDVGSGMASYYGSELAGNRTASGERFDPSELTAAHRTLAFGSRVRVTNLANGQSVIVRINDRGPFSRGRVIDVSDAAARAIDMRQSGTARVSITLLGDEDEPVDPGDMVQTAAAVGAAD